MDFVYCGGVGWLEDGGVDFVVSYDYWSVLGWDKLCDFVVGCDVWDDDCCSVVV